ncbi:macrophage mannose receptor 1-like [Glandiceps talaboti]
MHISLSNVIVPSKKWRDDLRCGQNYPLEDGSPAQCDPDSDYPCCSPADWCGITAAHCDCANCHDYRVPPMKWRDDFRCGPNYPLEDGSPAQCDPDSDYPCCSTADYCGITAAHCDCDGCIDYRDPNFKDLLDKYYIFSDTKTQAEAVAACEASGLRLARDSSDAIHAALHYKILSEGKSGQSFYIDGKNVNGVPQYLDGTVIEYSHFAPGQPDASDQCFYLWSKAQYSWDDYLCTDRRGYICEEDPNVKNLLDKYFLFTNAKTQAEASAACEVLGLRLARDTSDRIHNVLVNKIALAGEKGQSFYIDGKNVNGVNQYLDGDLIEYTHFAPGQPDALNQCYYLWSAAQYSWDDYLCTDRRGYICEGDPSVRNLFDNYYLFSDSKTQADAAIACEASGLRLTRDSSDKTHAVIVNKIFSEGKDGQSFYIDGKNVNSVPQYLDGEVMTYTHFASGQPDSTNQCFYLWSAVTYDWDDHYCTDKRGYVCDKDPKANNLLDKFFLFTDSKTQAEAATACEAIGLRLARDTSDVIHSTLVNKIILAGKSGQSFYIDGKNVNGVPTYLDGETIEYKHFASGQPDTSDQCFYLWSAANYNWDDHYCSDKRGYICEDASAPSVVKYWRGDGRCGPNYPLSDGSPAQCDPDSQSPCCSSLDYCGSTAAHCYCDGCIDYRVPKKWRDDLCCGSNYPLSDGSQAQCVPDSLSPCCSPYDWCGNTVAHCDFDDCIDYRGMIY